MGRYWVMKKREIPCSYFEDPATLEAKRQRESKAREKRYLSREKQKAIAVMRKRRRVRLALEGFVDVFKFLPQSDLNTLEISCSTFHSIVSTHMDGVCLLAVDFARVGHRSVSIFIDGKAMFRSVAEALGGAPAPVGQKHFRCIDIDGDDDAKFRAVDEGHTDAVPVGQKLFGENVYVLMQRVVSKCFVKTMRIDDLADLDDVAFKALIAIQPNVGSVVFSGTYGVSSTADNVPLDVVYSALFGFPSMIFQSFRAPYEVFTGHAIKRLKDCVTQKLLLDAPMDQDRYHDEDLISLFSIEPVRREMNITFRGLRLSSEFLLKIIEAHTTNVSTSNLRFFIRDSKVDEQNRGTHSFAEIECVFGRTAELVLKLQNLPCFNLRVNLDTGNITISRLS
ncbi:hypothetical protein AAVH_08402 [Aphelenchoides avenae]|nr:hypothetical protein AAVH_08402 [Aphelenchus avenae]